MIEDKIWNTNPSTYIIGSDEVGRGSFAGPIGAASVRINYEHKDLLLDVKDSKKLSPKKRNQIFELVQESEIEYSYVERDNEFIDLYGIKLANEKVLEDSISSIFLILYFFDNIILLACIVFRFSLYSIWLNFKSSLYRPFMIRLELIFLFFL